MDAPSQLIQRVIKEYKKCNYKAVIKYGEIALQNSAGTETVYSILGESYRKIGEFGKAIRKFSRALDLNKSSNNYRNLALALQGDGQLQLALDNLKKALSINPLSGEIQLRKGIIEDKLGFKEEALNSFKSAIKLDETDDLAFYFIGKILYENGQAQKSIDYFKHSSSLNPNSEQAVFSAGLAFIKLDKYTEAIEEFEKVIVKNPTWEMHSNLGLCYFKLGQRKKAEYHLTFASNDPSSQSSVLLNLGSLYASYGEFNKAARTYKRVIDNFPDCTEAIRRYSQLNRYSDEEVSSWLDKYSDSTPKTNERRDLCFSLADYYERQQDFDSSYRYLSEGNSIEKTKRGYLIREDTDFIEKIISNAEKLERQGFDSREFKKGIKPIFIVGMPRSGTTLLERILSSHEEIETIGETNYVKYYGGKLAIGVISPTRENISKFRDSYLSVISCYGSGVKYCIDKMPLNFRFLGLISAAFPEGKIICISRDARAVCWSNYRNYFPSSGLGYSFDLHDIIKFYTVYKNMMSHWKKRLGNRIIEVEYGDLVENTESEIYRLLTELDIEAKSDMQSFHKNLVQVKTSSYQQVRKPIYKGSVDQWRRYDKFVSSIFGELDA